MLCSCSPEIEAPYVQEEEKERLLGLYQYLHSRAHNSSRPLKNIYFTGPRENLLAWVRAVCRVWVSPSSLVAHSRAGRGHNTAPAAVVPRVPPPSLCMVLLGISLPPCTPVPGRDGQG